jgi:hypothetical protein
MKGFKKQLLWIASIAAFGLPAYGLGELDFITGFEGAIREPDHNEDQAWTGFEYTLDRTLWNTFQPYVRAAVGWDDSHYLVSTGLRFEFQPFEDWEDLTLGLQTGPAYTEVGAPHTGSKWNWTSDVFVRYWFIRIGYSHTSNGGIDAPNSGLDMVIVGISLPLERLAP